MKQPHLHEQSHARQCNPRSAPLPYARPGVKQLNSNSTQQYPTPAAQPNARLKHRPSTFGPLSEADLTSHRVGGHIRIAMDMQLCASTKAQMSMLCSVYLGEPEN